VKTHHLSQQKATGQLSYPINHDGYGGGQDGKTSPFEELGIFHQTLGLATIHMLQLLKQPFISKEHLLEHPRATCAATPKIFGPEAVFTRRVAEPDRWPIPGFTRILSDIG